MLRRLVVCFYCLLWVGGLSSAQSGTCAGTPESRLVTGEQAEIIASSGSNLRSRPAEDAILLTIIPNKAIIPVIDGPFCGGGYAWWQVDYDGERGWVAEGVDEFYWLSPHIIQRSQIDTVRIEVQPELTSHIIVELLSEPARSQFVLEGYPVQSNELIPFIVIFDEIPETINSNALSDTPIAYQESINGGQRFVELYFTGELSDTSEILPVYRYQSLTDDNRYIDAYFPLSVPGLPLDYNPPETDRETYNQQYLDNSVGLLEALSMEDFTPRLDALDGIIRSIQMDAPRQESMLFIYDSSGISLDYHPALATEITETLIPAGDSPRHIQLLLNDFPGEQAVIRIYRTDDIPGTALASLQQILSRQPSNPPQISVLPESTDSLFREDIQYLDFVNGSGIRYITAVNGGERLYSFQGLSSTGDFFVSMLFSLNDDALLSLIDRMVQSLQIGE